MIVAASFGVGAVLGLVFISKFIKFSLRKWPSTVYMAIFGILVASPFAIFWAIYHEDDYLEKISNANAVSYITGALMFLVGVFLVLVLPYILNKKNKHEDNIQEEEKQTE